MNIREDYLKLGICKFKLFGSPNTAQARVEIEAEFNDVTVPSREILIYQSWLLMIESQIGKLPLEIQDVILDTLYSQTIAYFKHHIVPPRLIRTTIMHHLATLEIQLCYKNRFFTLAHPRDFDTRLRADGLVSLIIVNSLSAICDSIGGNLRDATLCLLIYGLHKWNTIGRPGKITAFTQTWDFRSMKDMLDRGWELVQEC